MYLPDDWPKKFLAEDWLNAGNRFEHLSFKPVSCSLPPYKGGEENMIITLIPRGAEDLIQEHFRQNPDVYATPFYWRNTTVSSKVMKIVF